VAMSEAGTEAVTDAELTNVVTSGEPFQFTTEVLTKLVPVSVIVKAVPPAVAELGERAKLPGNGLLITKLSPLDVPPPGVGLTTVTVGDPPVATFAVGTAADSDVLLLNVVTSAVPFQSTVEVLTKPLPVTESENPDWPAVKEFGEMDVSVGVGLLTVNVCAVDVPPAGRGLNTVTEFEPAAVKSAAGTVAVRVVVFVKEVLSGVPFQLTTELLTKFVPVSVIPVATAPTVAELGAMDVSAGAGLLIAKLCPVDVPPPGVGLKTVTEGVPELARSEAGTAAVSEVALTNVVVSAVPFQFTTEPATKFVPVTVSVNADPPVSAELGESEVSVGAGLLMVKVCPEVVPPPGAAFVTVTETVLPFAMSEAGTAAVSEVALTNVVTSAVPFQFTVEPATKFVPVSVSVNVEPPAVADAGEMEVSVGDGLLIVKTRSREVPPPGVGFATDTALIPPRATSDAGTLAVSEVSLTNVVVSGVPSHLTVDAPTNPVPVRVSVNVEAPAVTKVGEMEVSVGAGLLMLKVCAEEVPPPGVGLKTVTEAVPDAAMSEAGTVAVSEVALTNVVASAMPFQFTTELLTKFVPLRVIVN
jgi:hypothetical protein